MDYEPSVHSNCTSTSTRDSTKKSWNTRRQDRGNRDGYREEVEGDKLVPLLSQYHEYENNRRVSDRGGGAGAGAGAGAGGRGGGVTAQEERGGYLIEEGGGETEVWNLREDHVVERGRDESVERGGGGGGWGRTIEEDRGRTEEDVWRVRGGGGERDGGEISSRFQANYNQEERVDRMGGSIGYGNRINTGATRNTIDGTLLGLGQGTSTEGTTAPLLTTAPQLNNTTTTPEGYIQSIISTNNTTQQQQQVPPPPENQNLNPDPDCQNPDPDSEDSDRLVPLLSHYDPYHNTVVALPGPWGPMSALSALPAAPSLPPPPCLHYQDFAPLLTGYEDGNLRCTQQYGDLIEQANGWLRQNPHLRVKSAESVVYNSASAITTGDTETVVIQQAVPPESTYCMTSLRLWVCPNEDPTSFGQRIGHRDFRVEEGEVLYMLINRANNTLSQDPLYGTVFCCETLLHPNYPSWSTEHIFWSSCPGPHNLFLRLFYVETDSPQQNVIGIKDIVPELINDTYESYNCLMKRASRWISGEQHITVTNLKSLYLSKTDGSSQECSQQCQHHFRDLSDKQYFQVLRLFYIKSRPNCPNRRKVVNCMTFTPVQMTLGTNVVADFERMKHTMVRITAWLQLAGASVLSAESFVTPMLPNMPNHTLPELTFLSSLPRPDYTQHKFLIHIRLFLDGDFEEPDPSLLPPLPASLTDAVHYSLEQREYTRLYLKHKKRTRRRRLIIVVFVGIIFIASGVILLDQAFNFIHL